MQSAMAHECKFLEQESIFHPLDKTINSSLVPWRKGVYSTLSFHEESMAPEESILLGKKFLPKKLIPGNRSQGPSKFLIRALRTMSVILRIPMG